MTTMPHAPPGSLSPSMLSKRLDCERVEQLQAEATDTHKRLKGCIRKDNMMEELCAMTETVISKFRDRNAKLKQKTKDSEEQARDEVS